MLTFLANQVDLLSASINQIQVCVAKVMESFDVKLDTKVKETDMKLQESMADKVDYLEQKLDTYKATMEKQYQAVHEENFELRKSLEKYILDETERENRIKECLNNATIPGPCITEIIPLKEDLERKLLDIDTRLVECEQYSRRENLIISGIPESVNQKQLQEKVIQILGTIGLNIVYDDISACHRLYNPPNSQYPAKVIVRFVNRKVANFCLEHRDDLQHQSFQQLRLNLRFYESLCSKNEESLRICKWLSQAGKIQSYFFRNGFLKIVKDEHGRPQKINHPEILRKMFADIPVGI